MTLGENPECFVKWTWLAMDDPGNGENTATVRRVLIVPRGRALEPVGSSRQT